MLTQYKPVCILFFGALSCFPGLKAQDGFSLKIETPLFQEVQTLGVSWSVGDYAIYHIFKEKDQKEKIGQHKIEITGIKEIGGTRFFQITTTMLEGDQRTDLTFSVSDASKSFNLAKAKDLKVKTPFGSFSLKYADVRPEEMLIQEGSEVLIHGDREIEVTRYSVHYSDQKPDSTIWVNPSMGPYGLVKGQIYVEDRFFYYVLAEHHSN